MVGGVRGQLHQAAICTLDLQAVMHSVTLTLDIQGQLAGLLLDLTDDIEVAGSGHGGSKGDCQGKLAFSRHCPTARLKGQHGLSACNVEQARLVVLWELCRHVTNGKLPGTLMGHVAGMLFACVMSYDRYGCHVLPEAWKDSWEKLLGVLFVDGGLLKSAVRTSGA